MEVWNIITFVKYPEDIHLENVQSFVLMGIGNDQQAQYEKAKEAFIDAIGNYHEEGELSYKQATEYIEKGIYEDESCIIYFKVSDDVD